MGLRNKYEQEYKVLQTRLLNLRNQKAQLESIIFSSDENSLIEDERDFVLSNYTSKKDELLTTDAEIYLLEIEIQKWDLLFATEENSKRLLIFEDAESPLFFDAISELTNLDELHIKGGIKEFPIQISKMTNLKVLNLSENKLIALPSEIGNLIGLTYLDLSSNHLAMLPSKIGSLRNLNYLNLNHNKLTSLPETIGGLTKLEHFEMISNYLSKLPKSISKLRSLSKLVLHNNELRELPDNIAGLSGLTTLDLTLNRLNYLPRSIGELINLEELYLSGNALFELPPEIGNLIKLRSLLLGTYIESEYDILSLHEIVEEFTTNNVSKLPSEIQNLNNLESLDLTGNPLPIPPEILESVDKPKEILNYYFRIQSEQRKQLLECKLIVVGQGAVGKTSLISRILYNTFDQHQHKTEGISITQWQIEENQKWKPYETASQEPGIKLNIWDFGGQEIMHATHQFFLTRRSIYLLVLDSRLTQEENRVEYWLKIIQSFGGPSPVVLVGNKNDQHPLDIDQTGLRKKYPNIVGIFETSASTSMGIDMLKTEIAKQVYALPHVRDLLPDTWFTVKSKLEELARDKNFFTQDEYLYLCETNTVKDEISQRTLIGFLHDLGVVLHFQDDPRLESLGILNPQWVTNGVYKILNSHELFQSQGKLTLTLLNQILNVPEYPSSKRLFIVDMMKKFELCYDIETDKYFLVPDLLPKDEIYTGEWADALAFQYHYSVLPSSIITRFIVRMNAFIHKNTIWRSGVVLKHAENTALVKADTEEKKVFIWVSGQEDTRRDLLAIIRAEFDAIHRSIAKIDVAEKVPVPNIPDAPPIDLAFLQKMDSEGRESLPVQAGDQIIDLVVREVLSRIETKRNITVNIGGSVGGNFILGDDNKSNTH